VIHLAGFAKAYGPFASPCLGQPISRAAGLGWLAATVWLDSSAVSMGRLKLR
jgi:hypothetical protein